jgi:small nuclear ribonucleoprotein (snRNP)-like protein
VFSLAKRATQPCGWLNHASRTKSRTNNVGALGIQPPPNTRLHTGNTATMSAVRLHSLAHFLRGHERLTYCSLCPSTRGQCCKTCRTSNPSRIPLANDLGAQRELLLTWICHRVNEEVIIRLKWGQTEYKGRLVSIDSYMNIQLSGAEEWIDQQMTSVLGQVLIR